MHAARSNGEFRNTKSTEKGRDRNPNENDKKREKDAWLHKSLPASVRPNPNKSYSILHSFKRVYFICTIADFCTPAPRSVSAKSIVAAPVCFFFCFLSSLCSLCSSLCTSEDNRAYAVNAMDIQSERATVSTRQTSLEFTLQRSTALTCAPEQNFRQPALKFWGAIFTRLD